MTRVRVLSGILLAVALSIGASAQSAQELYQRGLVQEQANGDLVQAIDFYSEAVRTAGKDRALAARALIRVGRAREKLGQLAEAVKAYTEVVRVYPEQRAEAAIAQERLTALRGASRVELAPTQTPVERVDDAQLATRMATFLWRGAPDADLLDAARRGDLREAAGLRRQVVRMLQDPRSDALVDHFFAGWLSLDRLQKSQPDPSLYPQVDGNLLRAMEMETRLFLQSQLREDRDAVELWTADYTFVNDRLARHYGLPGISGSEFRRVSWPDTRRAGILGQAGLLTALSQASRTSPTVRGVFVLTRFLGMDAPAPPANVPPLADNRPGTMRDRMAAHKLNPSCASCHAMFDPLGFALENFDATGAWRTTDGGAPIDASGRLMDGTAFDGPAELRAGLMKFRNAYYTGLTQQLLAYALNRTGKSGRLYDYEMPAVRKVVRDAAGNHRWSSILTGIIASAPFQTKNIVP